MHEIMEQLKNKRKGKEMCICCGIVEGTALILGITTWRCKKNKSINIYEMILAILSLIALLYVGYQISETSLLEDLCQGEKVNFCELANRNFR